MAKVISFVSGKGGVGKTLGAILTSGEYALRENQVLVIDADPTQRFSDWFSESIRRGNGPEFMTVTTALTKAAVAREVQLAHGKFDYVVIDAPGTEGAVNQEVLRQSDIVATPVKIGRDEVKAMAVVAADVAQVSDELGLEIPHVTYVTELAEVQKSLSAYATLHNFIVKLQEDGYSTRILETELYSRNIYKELRNGLGPLQIIDPNPTITKARLEVHRFVRELDEILAVGKTKISA